MCFKKEFIKPLFLSILFFQFAILSSAQEYSAADDSLSSIFQYYRVAGFSVAVVKENKLVYAKSFGFKNLEDRIPLTNENIFRIASVSKSFTVTSLMQLIQKKKLHLNDDVSKLIGFTVRNPKFPEKKITLRMLLSHTSSINDSQGYFTLDAINPGKNPDWAKCYNDYEPGKGYQYCNLNFNMAGSILEKYSGERFDHYVVNHVLKPLKIYGGYNVNELDSNLFARIYEYNPDSAKFFYSPDAYAPRKKEIENYVMGYSTPIFSPTGGMKISATGLARYMTMHMDNGEYEDVKIISRKSERLMRKPLSDKENYGLALLTTQKLIPGETLIGHTGNAYGLFSAMFFEPGKKFGIVVISNGCDPRYLDGYNVVIRKAVNILYREIILK
ncbi:MAG: beta-lactamase family protein [Bacteroidetes bacterium]|nr:beta-lactamase family protein [Bacteroidota bacterium]